MRVLYDINTLYKMPVLRCYFTHLGRLLDPSDNLNTVIEMMISEYDLNTFSIEELVEKLPSTDIILADVVDNILPKDITLEVVDMTLNKIKESLETAVMNRLQGNNPILLIDEVSNLETATRTLNDTFQRMSDISSLKHEKTVMYHHRPSKDISRIIDTLDKLVELGVNDITLNLVYSTDTSDEIKILYDDAIADFMIGHKDILVDINRTRISQ